MILLSELPAASFEPRQSDATKKIVPQRKSSDVRHLSKSPPQRDMS